MELIERYRHRHRHRCYLEPRGTLLLDLQLVLLILNSFVFAPQPPPFTILFYVFDVIKQESQNQMSSVAREINCTKLGNQEIQSHEKCRNAKSYKVIPCQNILKFKYICNSLLKNISAISLPCTASVLYRIEHSS